MTRERSLYALALGAVMAVGLGTRRYGPALPDLLARYGGDTLWATMIFVALGLLAPTWPTRRVAAGALLFCYLIEASQLWQAPWLNALRRNAPGGLVLGRGFLWSDLLCYAVGVAFGVSAEWLVRGRHERPNVAPRR